MANKKKGEGLSPPLQSPGVLAPRKGGLQCSPQMELVLVGLGNCSQRVKMAQELNSVMWLDVVHAIAEHLQKRVQNAPGVGLEDSR